MITVAVAGSSANRQMLRDFFATGFGLEQYCDISMLGITFSSEDASLEEDTYQLRADGGSEVVERRLSILRDYARELGCRVRA
ncbi:MAG TPA: hypothetical protein VGD98_09870 [Ktedonobacteraceae bacterium]